MLDQITPLILTRDEEANLPRTLARLGWAKDVVIVDSFSTDATLDIAARFPNVRLFTRELDDLAGQSNYGLAQVRTPWVLLLDADYFVTDELIAELAALQPSAQAYVASFRYAIGGRPLRASLYPPRVVLLHRDHCRVWQDGHAHRVKVDGATGVLQGQIVHDDRKSLRRFVQRQRKYMREEAAKLRRAEPGTLNLAARLRKLVVVAPFAVVVHALFVKGLVFDGVAGLHYAFERFVAECILSWELVKGGLRIED
ncbi:MAG TPA: glycosyltransferase family 2 protein [Thermoanaerobaculia bacterium]|jgi:glycosyltransferase involved in cell wall biosynthesis